MNTKPLINHFFTTYLLWSIGTICESQNPNFFCSTVRIDQMVDIACSVPGVVGSQIAGAGLGGCIMIVAKKAAWMQSEGHWSKNTTGLTN